MFGLTKYLYIALLVCALVAFAGFRGYGLGKTHERAGWLKKQVTEVANASKQLEKLHNDARAKESLAAVELSNIQNELSEAQNEINDKDGTINRQRDAIASLRWGANAVQASGSEAGAVTASTRECDGETITEFSGEIFEYLYTEFGKIDKIIEQLTAAQAVIELDRAVVNEKAH